MITANKALLSAHGQELFALASAHGVDLKFEGAVCGGIPIVKVLRESLMGNRVKSIIGIVNGTTNFILTRMTEEKLSFAQALELAQAQGFAEADPTLDIGGRDAAQKIGLLASLAFGSWIDPSDILCEGITGVTGKDVEFCLSSGFVIKLDRAGASARREAPRDGLSRPRADGPSPGLRAQRVQRRSHRLGLPRPLRLRGSGRGRQAHGFLGGLRPR